MIWYSPVDNMSQLGEKCVRYFCWQYVFLFPSSDGEFTLQKQ